MSALDFANPELRRQRIGEKGLTVFSPWSPAHPDLEVDVFVAEPFDFEAAYSRAARAPLMDTFVTVVSVEDLIQLKRAAGRAQDLADIQALERLGGSHG